MTDYTIYKNYKPKSYETDQIVLSKLTLELSKMAYTSSIVYNAACEENKSKALKQYWSAFNDLSGAMTEIMHQTSSMPEDERRSTMNGMLHACNTIIKMVEDEEFWDHEED